MRFKTIIRNINLLNIILITAIIILANYTVLPMFNMNIRYTLPAGKKTIGDTDEKPADNHIPSLTDYTMIAEENLFHPERKIPAEKKDEQPLPKPEFVLYGTLITDDISMAYLEDLKAPHNTQGRGRRQTVLRKGDTMSGFTLKEIETDKVVMLKGEERLVISLNDPSRPKTRESVETTTSAFLGPQGTQPVIQPFTPGKSRAPLPTTTSVKQPVQPAPERIPAQTGTTPQRDLSKRGPHSIKNAPYIPSPNRSGSKGLLGIPR